METIIVSFGGSVILSEQLKNSYFQQLKSLLKKQSKTREVFLVVGGGKPARNYIQRGRELKLDEKTLDEIGIEITRVNAKLIIDILGLPQKNIPNTTNEAKELQQPIVVMGGTTPGHSTDMVAAELAEKTQAAKLIIATDVDGIYDKDPNKNPDAKQLKQVAVEQLIKQYGTSWESAGKNVIIDGPALEIIRRGVIKTYVLNGKKISELEKAFNDKEFNGTTIVI